MSAPKLRVVGAGDRITIDGPGHPLIPEGTYRAVYTGHEFIRVRRFENRPKLYVHFRVVDAGEAFEAALFRAYNVKDKGGRFGAPRRGALTLEILRMLPAGFRVTERPSIREAFAGRVVLVKVGTVETNAAQRNLPQPMRYSVIREVIGPETANADDAEAEKRRRGG